MSDAPWAPKAFRFERGEDSTFGFCSLCGRHAPEGIFGRTTPEPSPGGRFFCCLLCARAIGRAAEEIN